MTDFSETAANLNIKLDGFMQRAEQVTATVGRSSLLASGMRYERQLFGSHGPRSAAIRVVAITTQLPLGHKPYSLAIFDGGDRQAPLLSLATSLPSEARGLIGGELDEDGIARLGRIVFGAKPLRLPPRDAAYLFERVVDARSIGAELAMAHSPGLLAEKTAAR